MAQEKTVKNEKYTPGQKRTRKRVMIGRIIFTLFLCAYMGTAFYFAKYGYDLLMDWLVRLEASQPDIRSQEVFTELFADPDWNALYYLAGEEDTLYEDGSTYAAYMENLVGDQELTYVETSAGLSGDKKFIVKLDSTKVAEYTLQNIAPEGEQIPDWTLGEVTLFYTRQESLTVFTIPGHTVYINGVALDPEEYVISTSSRVVEDYLSDDLHGYRDMTLYFDGLLMQPEVTILDENGVPMEVIYDADTKVYAEQLPDAATIPDDLKERVILAAQSYGRYMINARNHKLSDYFDKNCKAYQDIIAFEDRWTVQNYRDYTFDDIQVFDYYQYSDTYFSARITMTMNVIRTDGTVKPFYVDTTFFVYRNDSGVWMVERMTNVDIQAPVQYIKLVYMNGSEEVHSEWVRADAISVTLPSINIPSGKEFLGWYSKTVDGLNTSYTLVFSPSDSGVITLPEDYMLTPMVLYAQFR